MRKLIKRALVIVTVLALIAVAIPSTGNKADASTPTTVKKATNASGIELPDGYYNRKVVGYFPNYAINSEAHGYFDITQLQWDKLTHVQYAFVVADESTFELVPSDVENDVESKFEGRTFSHKGKEIKMDDSLGYYGQFNLMHTMQKMYPDVTVLASTGGWAASRTLWLVTDNEANMNKFADSAVSFIRKYGFDGLDIDFEFPSETSQSGNPADFDLSEPRRSGISARYTQFIKILRNKLDQAAKEDNRYYWLTSAVSASSWVLGGQTQSDFLNDLDFVSIMSYDYHGGWNQFVENQANIYADPADTETKNMAMPTLGFNWSMAYYRGTIQSEKILMGVPYYTRGWTNVQGGTNGLHGSSNTPATGNDNIWCDLDENGNEVAAGANPLWHVLNLLNEKDSNYKKYWDATGRVPYVWNAATKTFLTFEDEQSIQERINFVKENNLGGVLIWVMHGDYDYDAAADKYVIGDTLTTMLYDQFKAMEPAKITSDIDVTQETLDFSVDFGGKYDHPNYVYSIRLTNNTGEDLKSWNFSFDLPESCIYGGSWSGTASVAPSINKGFNTVTIQGPGWQTFANGSTVELTGSIKLNFSGVKNFKLNGKAMKSEVEAEKVRLARLTGEDVVIPTIKPTETPIETEAPTEKPIETETPTEKPIETETPTEKPIETETPTEKPIETETPTEKPAGDTYSASQIYTAGDKVVYNGATYVCKWWTQGTAPGTLYGPWEVQAETSEDGSQVYMAGKAYVGGDIVSYNGAKYKANWWTMSTPGSDSSWSVVK